MAKNLDEKGKNTSLSKKKAENLDRRRETLKNYVILYNEPQIDAAGNRI